ncbi:hypothetical protein FRC02_010062 [Tulasnella sp. 418]|nr:hypothetical protein FRC02_010062 [Tulasnella sp. 418]
MKAIARTTTNTGSALRKATRRFSTSRSVSDAGKVVVGVRREDPNRIWERRCPVTPDAVNELVRDGVEVLVQPCERRVWSDDEFVKAGAKIHPTLHPANILVGIKEIPIPELDGGLLSSVDGRPRTHVMFSHTAKGQLYNMPLLSRFVGETETDGPQLVDYELLTGEDGKRVVGFGWFAGAAGVIEGLTASAHDFLSLGISSPFLYLPRPYSHPNLEDMRKSLRSVGEMISTKGMPRSTGPFVIAVTGNGNVATGALDLIKELPVTFVKAEDLPALVSNPDADLRKIYVVHVQSASYLVNNQNKPFDRSDYYANPTNYESLFFEKIAPYTSLLINGVGWSQSFPRLLSTAQLSKTIQLAKSIGRTRFRTIADITCDLSGGIEFVNRACTIDDPFFYTDGKGKPKQVEDGVQVMSIDILPSELPLDASKHFSKAFRPYLGAMVRKYQGKNTEEDAKALEAIERATIAQHGQLKPRHQWLTPLIDSHGVEGVNQKTATVTSTVSDKVDLDVKADLGGLESSAPSSGTAAGILKKKNVLLLGSGMVAKPAVDEFLKREDINLVVASNNFAEAEQLIRGSESASAVFLDVSDNAVLSRLIGDADVVVRCVESRTLHRICLIYTSLLVFSLHPCILRLARYVSTRKSIS